MSFVPKCDTEAGFVVSRFFPSLLMSCRPGKTRNRPILLYRRYVDIPVESVVMPEKLRILFGLVILVSLLCGAAAADDVWITLDPVLAPVSSDTAYRITGSTNAPDDIPIVISIYRTAPDTRPADTARILELPRIFTVTLMAGGSDTVRSWSAAGPVPRNMIAGNAGYIVAASLLSTDDELLATAYLPEPDRWASADPVPDRTTGKPVRLSGITNIPAGESVSVEVVRVAESDSASSRVLSESVFSDNVPVAAGEDNTWSVMMDTAGFLPGVYAVNLKNVLYQQGPRFLLEPAKEISPWWITIHPLPDTVIGKQVVISGSTNLPAGTLLDVVVKSSSLLAVGPESVPKIFSGTVTVQEGAAGVNVWHVSMDTHGVHADQYEVAVTHADTSTRSFEYINLCTAESLSGTSVSGYQFTMNEVRYPDAGRSYVFSGSTTAPPGTMIVTNVYRIDSTVSGIPDVVTSLPMLYETRTLVREGENAVNYWVSESVSVPERLGEENVRYVAAAYPEGIRVAPAVRIVPGSGNWTTTDPVSDTVTGAELCLSGQTNLPVGEIIPIEIYAVVRPFDTAKKPAGPVYSAECIIGTDSSWSIIVNTTAFPMGTYTVTASHAPYLSGPVFSLAIPGERQWIAVDPIPFAAQNDSFVLSGTTGLDEDLQLLIEVYPLTSDQDSRSSSRVSGMHAVTKIRTGENGKNTWSVPVSTLNWKADTYLVKVTAVEVDLTTLDTLVLYPAGSVPQETAARTTSGFGTGILALSFALAVLCSVLRRT